MINVILGGIIIILLVSLTIWFNRFISKHFAVLGKPYTKIAAPVKTSLEIREYLRSLHTVDEKVRACQALVGGDIILVLGVSNDSVSILDCRWMHFKDMED